MDSIADTAPSSDGEDNKELEFPELLPHHLDMLLKSGIAPEVIKERGYRSVTKCSELVRLGFGKGQSNVPTLLVPLHGVVDDERTYQHRPDAPRADKKRPGRTIKYETPFGGQLIIDVPKRVKRLLGDPSVPLFWTEGAKKADAGATKGLAVIALSGVWAWKHTNDDGGKVAIASAHDCIAHNDNRPEYIVFDSDAMSNAQVYKALARYGALLKSWGARVFYIYLPSGPHGEKVGLDDFFAAGDTVDDLLALATEELRVPEGLIDDLPEYEEKGDGLYWNKRTANAILPTRLTNFSARISSQVFLDDGVTETVQFEISATCGERAKVFRVASGDFASLDWVLNNLGGEAIVEPGSSLRDRAKTAIQFTSGKIPERRVLARTGWWQQPDGSWIYAYAAGAIGAKGVVDGVEVELPKDLQNYRLPAPPQGADLVEATRSVIRFLDLGPDAIVMPLFCAIWRSALAPASFSIHVEGESGAFKTQVAALAQQHFGAAMNDASLPANWSSTANFLEKAAAQAAHAVFMVDDFVAKGPPQEVAKLHAKAERLFRAQGNHCGRGRMCADGSLRPTYAPQGLTLSTGEELPFGQSLRARILALHFEADTIKQSVLTACQADANAGLYAAAMAGFLRSVAGRYADLLSTMRQQVLEFRDRASREFGHRRTPEIVAELFAGMKAFLTHALDIGAITREQAADLERRAWHALVDAAGEQTRDQEPAAPHRRWVDLLNTALATGLAHIANREDGGAPGATACRWGWRPDGPEGAERPLGKCVGHIEGENLYVNPTAALAVVKELAQRSGDFVALSESTMNRRLFEHKLLVDTDKTRETFTVRRTIVGRARQDVLWLDASTFGVDTGADRDQPQQEAVQQSDQGDGQATKPKQESFFDDDGDTIGPCGG